MKLYYAPASPFARKCRIVARELSIALEEIQIDPWTDEKLAPHQSAAENSGADFG